MFVFYPPPPLHSLLLGEGYGPYLPWRGARNEQGAVILAGAHRPGRHATPRHARNDREAEFISRSVVPPPVDFGLAVFILFIFLLSVVVVVLFSGPASSLDCALQTRGVPPA